MEPSASDLHLLKSVRTPPFKSRRPRAALGSWKNVLTLAAGLLLAQGVAASRLSADDPSLIVGPFIQVNSPMSLSNNYPPDVVVLPGGAFIATWESEASAGTDSDGNSIQARLFDTNGSPLGAPFQINDVTTGDQSFPSIAAAADGSFVVTWTSETSPGDTDGTSVKLRRFDSSGTPLAGEVLVNSDTLGDQTTGSTFYLRFQSIAMAPSGDFVVVWLGGDVKAQRFNSTGATVGSEFQVNTSGFSEEAPSVAMASDGGFVVVWEATRGHPDRSIQVKRYNPNGSTLLAQFQIVDLNPFYAPRTPRVDFFSNGDFVVVWQFSRPTAVLPFIESSVRARKFSAAGVALLNEMEVTPMGLYLRPAVATEPGGEFVVTYEEGIYPFEPALGARRYDAQGFAIGYLVNLTDYDSQYHYGSAIDSAEAGEFVIAWANAGQDYAGYYDILASVTQLAPIVPELSVPSLSPSRLALLAGLLAAAGVAVAQSRARRARWD